MAAGLPARKADNLTANCEPPRPVTGILSHFFKVPHFLDTRLTVGGEVVSLMRQAILVTGLGGP
jgi:hypothetical protein